MKILISDVKNTRIDKLNSSDWVAIAHGTGEDASFGPEYSWSEWALYRQALRDVLEGSDPANMPEEEDFVWPTRPSVPETIRQRPIEEAPVE